MKNKQTPEQKKLAQKIRAKMKEESQTLWLEIGGLTLGVSTDGRRPLAHVDGRIYYLRRDGKWKRIVSFSEEADIEKIKEALVLL